ncbi:MAG TPA: CYCXC family (seleno)protein [Candidatus Methylomirabilis sp.]|nr:CYCXC family (seleno)protein [Candidatus Methylomirabilis sp.]
MPAHHESAPASPLPATLNPTPFTDPVAQNAYAIAARIKKVLYQQPCYCHCDRSQGHKSLLDCFTGEHAAECGVCVAEDFYAYEQTRKGKTPAQIREGIERGDWRSVDLKKYDTPLPAKTAK